MILARRLGSGLAVAAGALVLWCLGAQPAPAENDDSVGSRFERAQRALAAGDYRLAEAEFETIVDLRPDVAGAHANLGISRYLQGRYAEAVESFRSAMGIQPDMPDLELYLGLSQARSGSLQKALPALASGFWNASDDDWRLQAGLLLVETYYANLEYDKALDVARALREAFPDNTDALYIAYRLHSDLGAKAIADLVKAGPGSARLHQVTAELLESEGDFPRAVRQYRKALEVDPRLAGANRALAVAIISSNPGPEEAREAEAALQRELSLNPRDPESMYQLGELRWRNDNPAQALEWFSKAVEVHPNFVEALVALGKVLLARGELARATGYLERAVTIDPDNDVAHYRLAQAHRAAGRDEQAGKSLAEFRRVRSAKESLGAIYRQVQRSTVTGQTVDGEGPAK